MPHMGASGLRRSWLLREACHRHWLAIAEQAGVKPSELRDRSGARVMASVVACTVNGDARAFREDDECQLLMTEVPRAQNGWRSQCDLSARGKSLRVEIMTSFARRNGRSNAELGAPDLGGAFRAERDHADARRTCLIRTLGHHDRARAAQDDAPPHLSFEIQEDTHLNGVGLVYFAIIHDMIEQAERNAAPEFVGRFGMRDRRAHFFGNLDVGDRLDITARASAKALSPAACVLVRSHARRASDGRVIACAESIYGA
ncbi:hypothetical protein PVT71_08900 [Salipiger sp. H15]|uniref:MaoC-like domain-containing protein n=1 Tax=Alloyangia sp. H15 TaxID=3029062 RepID=A0AAU8ACR7_9RHOB